MKVITEPLDIPRESFQNTVVTVGVFDGVHRGHAEVIRRLAIVKRAEQRTASVLLTFDRHPLAVTCPEMAPPMLTTLPEKLSLLETLDVDCVVIERFSAETAAIEYRRFIETALVGSLGMRHLVIGYDFHLGKGREGSQERLVEAGRLFGFALTVVPPLVLQGSVVSSTKIRRDIMERRLDHAERSLGRPYFFEGDVVRGEGLGARLDFPTANIEVSEKGKLVPPAGVYAVEIDAAGARYGGMMNIGSAPTLHTDGRRRIEVHIFGFSGDLYGRRVRIHCLGFLRGERRYENAVDLRAQLMHDRKTAYAVLEKRH